MGNPEIFLRGYCGRGVKLTTLFSAEITNEWFYVSISPFAFMACATITLTSTFQKMLDCLPEPQELLASVGPNDVI
jgi:hypothetical protein